MLVWKFDPSLSSFITSSVLFVSSSLPLSLPSLSLSPLLASPPSLHNHAGTEGLHRMELSRPADAILLPPSLSFHRNPSTQGSKAPGHQVLGHRSFSCELSSVPLELLVDFMPSVDATVIRRLHC